MRPSPILCKRIKSRAIGITTKSVGKGFYRGTGAGSLGSHTPTGGYLIDYRKVRSFVLPDLRNHKFTPFVSAELYKGYRRIEDQRGNAFKMKYDGLQYLEWFRHMNPAAYDERIAQDQQQEQPQTLSTTATSDTEPLIMEQDNLDPTNRQESPSHSTQR